MSALRCTLCAIYEAEDRAGQVKFIELVLGSKPSNQVASAMRASFPDISKGLSSSSIRATRRSDYQCCAVRNADIRYVQRVIEKESA